MYLILAKQAINKAKLEIKNLIKWELTKGLKFPWETEYNIVHPIKANKKRKKYTSQLTLLKKILK